MDGLHSLDSGWGPGDKLSKKKASLGGLPSFSTADFAYLHGLADRVNTHRCIVIRSRCRESRARVGAE